MIHGPQIRGVLMLIFSSIPIQTQCCGYSLESSQRDDSNEYSQHRVLRRNAETRKNTVLKILPLTGALDTASVQENKIIPLIF